MDRVKKQQLGFAIFFTVAFNVIFFLLIKENITAAGWVSYAFIHAALIVMIVAMLAGGNKNTLYASIDSPSFLGMVLFILIFVMGLLFTFVTPSFIASVIALGVVFLALLVFIIRGFILLSRE